MLFSKIPTRCDTNRTVQEQKMDRGIELRIKDVQSLYYQSSENKGANSSVETVQLISDIFVRICIKDVLFFIF